MVKIRGLRKRGWYYYARYPDGTGKMKQECTKCSNLKDAMVFLEERHRQVREGKLPSVLNMPMKTFKEYSQDYLIWVEMQKDYRNKKCFVKKLVNELGNVLLNKFNKLLVDSYQSKLLKKGLKPASVNREIAVLKHMFTMARDWNMIGETLYQQIKRVKQLPVDNRRLRFLNHDECKRLIDACDDHLRPIVEIAINTGMRKGEIFTLKWQNVNLFEGFIQVEDSKNKESRQMPMNKTVKLLLKEVSRRIYIDYVFFNPNTGKPYTDVKRAFKSACDRAKINNCTLHTLRHTFASHLVMEGVDLTTVKELMGHKDIKMTLRYAHLAPKHREESVNKLDGVTRSGQKVAINEGNKNARSA